MGSNLESRTERPRDGASHRGTPSDSPSESPLGEGFFRSLVECGTEALLVSQADGAIIYLNSSAARILGRESSEVLGRTLADFAHPNDVAELSTRAKAALDDPGTAVSTQIRFRRNDESEIVCELGNRAIADAQRDIILVTGLRDVTGSVAAERSLKLAQQTLRKIFEVSPDIISIHRLSDGTYLDGSALGTTGFTRNEIAGKPTAGSGIWANRAQLREFDRRLRERGVAHNMEADFKHKDGTIVSTLISGTVAEINGEACVLSITRDISRIKEAEKRLAESRTALRKILDATVDGIVVIRMSDQAGASSDNVFVDINAGFEREFGFSRDEVIGHDFRALNLSFDPSVPADFLRELLEKGSVQNMEAQLRRKNGDSIECLLSGALVDLGDERCAVVFGRNITELKEAQRQVLEGEQTFRTLFNAQLDGIMTLDVFTGQWIDANEEFFQSTGFTRDEVIGRRSREFNLFADQAEGQKMVDQLKTCGEVRNLEMTFLHKDGSLNPYLASAKVISLRGHTCCVIFARKIRELKEAQAALIKAREAALAASRAKSEFLSSMSHEIRTPMNAVLGMAELLGDTALTEEQRRFVHIMRGNGAALLDLINDILDLAKIESGHLTMESTEFDLEEQLGRVGEMMAIRAHQKGLELAVRIGPDVTTGLLGDPLRLRQILINLTGNAIKFTEKGEVTIAVETDQAAVADPDRPLALRFSVTDTGSGIPADKLGLIFERFTQADSSTTRKYGGSGLGLAIVRRLVELFGGEVSVQSEYGKGSCFSFTAHFGVGSAPAAAEQEPVSLNGVRVLVIDDIATNRLILKGILARAGAEVHEADGGEVGLAQLANARKTKRPYQLLLLDCRMPEIDGIEVARRLRAESDPDEIPAVVMLTSEDLAERIAQLREVGILTYVVKPVRRPDLMNAIGRAMYNSPKIDKPSDSRSDQLSTALPPLKILIADDSVDNRLLVRAYLKRSQCQLEEAEDGRIAQEKFKAGQYDLVLMDMRMPIVDGAAATRAIRAFETAKRLTPTPIIALTASALEEDVLRCREAGCDAHVSKPVTRSALIAAMRNAIGITGTSSAR